jgi:nitroimidazol reductase NimA-like FMN-containing flavoprotein (pyridoxamine 5'-phosphate oxidase superfamily)
MRRGSAMVGEHVQGGRLAELTVSDCWDLFRSREIARVAWNGPLGVAIAPVNYAVAESAVWFRTLPYSTLGRECAGQRLAVEVDHIEPQTHSGWSVVVAGTADLVRPDEVPQGLADMQAWPAGTRSQFVRVDPAEVTGRRLLQAPPG